MDATYLKLIEQVSKKTFNECCYDERSIPKYEYLFEIRTLNAMIQKFRQIKITWLLLTYIW